MEGNWTDAFVRNPYSPHRQLVIIGVAVVSAVSVSLGLVVIYLSLRLPNLKGKDFKLFLINLSIMDILFSIVYFLSFFVSSRPFWCPFSAFMTVLTGTIMLHAVVPISFNRYIGLCHPHSYHAFFGTNWKKGAFLMYPLVVGSIAPTLILILGSYNKVDGYDLLCVPVADGLSHPTNVIGQLNQAATYIPFIFCVYKMQKRLREKQKVQRNLQVTAERRKETKFLLKAILVQGLSPIPLQLPLFVLFPLGPRLSSDAQWIGAVAAVAGVIFGTTPVCDSLATLLIVKQYKVALLRALRMCSSKTAPAPLNVHQNGEAEASGGDGLVIESC